MSNSVSLLQLSALSRHSLNPSIDTASVLSRMLRALTVLRGSESVCRMENELSFCLRVQCLCAVLCCGNLFDNMLNCVGFVVN